MITFSTILVPRQSFRFAHKTSLIHSLSSTLDPVSSLLQFLALSAETHCPKLTEQAHAQAHRVGLTQHPLVAQKLIFLYCRFKELVKSQLVFDSLLVKNSHICNTLLNGYKTSNLFPESLKIFREMCESSNSPLVDEFTLSLVLKIVGDFNKVFLGKTVHGRGLKTGIVLDTVVGNALMSMYGKCGCFDDSLKLFDEMPYRNASSWNGIVSGYVKVNAEKGINAFHDCRLWEFMKGMQNEGLKFDAYTVSTLLSLLGEVKDKRGTVWNHGRELHCYCIRNGLDIGSSIVHDVHLGGCLVDMYSKNGKLDLGRRVFEGLTYKNVFAWTTMINGCVHCGVFDEALSHFRGMQWIDKVEPNKVSLVTVLPACNSVSGLMGGKQIHGFAMRRGLNHDISLSNALIDTYSKCGSLSYSTRVFEHECIFKDAVSWTSMIYGYGLHGQGQKAVNLFNTMMFEYGIKPDTTVVISLLSACRRSGLLNDGIKIYETVVNNYDIDLSIELCACVVEMFGQSGQFDRAMDFIKNMPVEPGPSIWGSLVSASQLHGNSEMTDLAYKSLIKIEPDNPSNYISLSNLYAASKRWDVAAQVRMKMRERGLRKNPGCSWISLNSSTHSFFVADKSHPCSDLIYTVLNELVLVMKLSGSNFEFVYPMEVLD